MKRLWSRKWTLACGVGMSLLLLIGALLLAGAVPGASRNAHAANGGGVCDLSSQHSNCTSKGVSASAGFLTDVGCLDTDVGVNVFQDVSHSATDPTADTTEVFVNFFAFDSCNFVTVASADGQAVGVDFQGDQQLTSSSLNATVPLTGFGVPDGYTLTISLTWQGLGTTTTSSDDSKFRSPSGHIITRMDITQRSALASGTITDGTTNFASAPTLSADLFVSQGGQVIINHP